MAEDMAAGGRGVVEGMAVRGVATCWWVSGVWLLLLAGGGALGPGDMVVGPPGCLGFTDHTPFAVGIHWLAKTDPAPRGIHPRDG